MDKWMKDDGWMDDRWTDRQMDRQFRERLPLLISEV
jgi:hypothetical protein